MLFDIVFTYFDFDPHNHNRYEGFMSVVGKENAVQYGARIADAANVTQLNVIDAFTGEIIAQFEGGRMTFSAD